MKFLILIKDIARSVRPRQWLKNLSLFAAITFWGELFEPGKFSLVSRAFLIFCAVSSAVYLINDIADAPKDRLHPIKKNRPIAKGLVPSWLAGMIAFFLLLFALPVAANLNRDFLLMIISYLVLQAFYIFMLRDIIIMDALAVAGGFVIRVYAGSVVAAISISSWLALTVVGLSLLLAFGKRRSERTLLEKIDHIKTRATLEHYPNAMLDAIISMASSMTILSYSLFAFQTSPSAVVQPLIGLLPQSLAAPKWMMLTIPLVIYGVARYLYVIYEKKEGESPDRVLLSDMPLLFSVTSWVALTIAIIYGLD